MRNAPSTRLAVSAVLLAMPLAAAGQSAPPDPQGQWRGTYQCAQGETNIRLRLDSVSGNGYSGIVDFEPSSNARVHFPAAEYTVSGQLEPDGHLLLRPGQWIKRPAPLFMGTLDGRLSPDGTHYEGVVVECGANRNFAMTHDAGPALAQATADAPARTKLDPLAAVSGYDALARADWQGLYNCFGLNSVMHLRLSPAGRGSLAGTVEFEPFPPRDPVQRASYRVVGQLQDDGSLMLVPQGWVRQQPGYVMSSITGTLSPTGDHFNVTATGCPNRLATDLTPGRSAQVEAFIAAAAASAADRAKQATVAAADAARTLRLGGVALGMTKEDAVAALKKAHPDAVVIDMYTGYGMNGSTRQGPLSTFRPADAGYLSGFVAVPSALSRKAMFHRDSDVTDMAFNLGCSAGERRRRAMDETTYRVELSPQLVAPRVLLVVENHSYCDPETRVPTVIDALYARYSRATTRLYGLRSDGERIGDGIYPGTGDGAAFLEWRFGASGAAIESVPEVPFWNTWGGMWRFLGNEGGGVVVHAEVWPQQDINYASAVQTVLWDDNAYGWYKKQQFNLLGELDRLGISVDRLHDKALLAKVKSAPRPPGY